MQVTQLSPPTRALLKKSRYDSIVGKHEGPFSWEWGLDDHEFLRLDNFDVLLPIEKQHHGNVQILRVIPSADSQTLTIFLKDTTYSEGEDDFFSGYLAICERFPDENFHVATVYHEWFALTTPFSSEV